MRRAVRACGRRPGATVLELVVALAVTGLVAALGAGAVGELMDRRRGLVAATAATERAAARRALVRQWMRDGTILQPVAQEQLAAAWTLPRTAGDVVTFTSNAATPADAADAVLQLYVDDDPGTAERGLCLAVRSGPEAPARQLELDATVTAVRVEYLEASSRRWMAASNVGAATALAARVHLDAAPGANAGAPARLAALPITVPMGRSTPASRRDGDGALP